ncbi:NUDIX domain-containing protein [Nibribacter ruber]|uniref:GDP-mannose pyrophosphatase n=1 Tax=Nibribacter ruber TaxID=2698458 RepID=A0A6P1P3Y6_9BACT|nr:NUDIX hydrolase [Nibribacter ruber]QHL89091.1 NUDIX domain-containing protein [Nibribacter ruber]
MKITKKETAYKGHYQLQIYTVKDGQEEFKREVFQTGTAAAALVFNTRQQKFILAKQFRPAVEQELVEVVAGMLDSPDEKPEDAITREIEEEIGFAVDKLEFIASFYPSPGACSERIVLFYAEVSHQVSEGGGKDDEHESIQSVSYSPQELADAEFMDGKTFMAVQWAEMNVLPNLTKK